MSFQFVLNPKVGQAYHIGGGKYVLVCRVTPLYVSLKPLNFSEDIFGVMRVNFRGSFKGGPPCNEPELSDLHSCLSAINFLQDDVLTLKKVLQENNIDFDYSSLNMEIKDANKLSDLLDAGADSSSC